MDDIVHNTATKAESMYFMLDFVVLFYFRWEGIPDQVGNDWGVIAGLTGNPYAFGPRIGLADAHTSEPSGSLYDVLSSEKR